jgi:hypothetical protein
VKAGHNAPRFALCMRNIFLVACSCPDMTLSVAPAVHESCTLQQGLRGVMACSPAVILVCLVCVCAYARVFL